MRFSKKDRQVTSTAVRLGKSFSAEIRTDFSPAGFVGVGIMVSTMLLSSAVIVAAARWRRRREPGTRIEAKTQGSMAPALPGDSSFPPSRG